MMWNRLLKNDKGFTGLEAAIVLVAFVVVAAVFSYVMLGAGFYTTQKSQEVVHTGVAQASSSLSPSGDVIVRGNATANTVDNITFYITNTAGGSSVDLNNTIITYIDDDDFVTQDELSADWKYEPVISNGYAWNLVEKGEKYKISVDLTTGNVTTQPKVNENIRIDVKPPEGAVLIIQKSMPAAISPDTYYAVY